MLVSAVVEGFLIDWCCFVKGFFIVRNLGQSSINRLWNVANNAWRVVRFFVDVEWNVVRLVEWHVRSIRQMEGHTKEVYDLFVDFGCDFKAMLPEDITKILLNFLCLTGRSVGYAKTVVSIQSKIVVMCIFNAV